MSVLRPQHEYLRKVSSRGFNRTPGFSIRLADANGRSSIGWQCALARFCPRLYKCRHSRSPSVMHNQRVTTARSPSHAACSLSRCPLATVPFTCFISWLAVGFLNPLKRRENKKDPRCLLPQARHTHRRSLSTRSCQPGAALQLCVVWQPGRSRAPCNLQGLGG